ncbi:MAG: hypothetical protein ACRDJI_09565 [Actinomycetota bacterium]
MKPTRRPRLELVSLQGNPTDAERAAIVKTLERMVDAERQSTTSSLWLRASRAHARRLGMHDYRDRFASEDVWRLSPRFVFGGREYPGLAGRGDAR